MNENKYTDQQILQDIAKAIIIESFLTINDSIKAKKRDLSRAIHIDFPIIYICMIYIYFDIYTYIIIYIYEFLPL